MGNALRCFWNSYCNPQTPDENANAHSLLSETEGPAYGIYLYRRCKPQAANQNAHVHNLVSNPRVSGLARDLQNFEITGDVPEGLSQYVTAGKRKHKKWYRKILASWKERQLPPRKVKGARKLIVKALQGHRKADVEGLLRFYGLSDLPTSVPIYVGIPTKGFKYQLHTLEVNAKDVADGDTITVFVDTKWRRKSSHVPQDVKEAVIHRRDAQAKRDYQRADALTKQIEGAGYRMFDGKDKTRDILARKYKVRLRGIDAPESNMPYGPESKQRLQDIIVGKRLKVFVYGEDQYGRVVADLFVDGLFVQEIMLKKGFAWHYAAYDKRPELAMWEEQARTAKLGLWGASKNPQKPWEWRRIKRGGAAAGAG